MFKIDFLWKTELYPVLLRETVTAECRPFTIHDRHSDRGTKRVRIERESVRKRESPKTNGTDLSKKRPVHGLFPEGGRRGCLSTRVHIGVNGREYIVQK